MLVGESYTSLPGTNSEEVQVPQMKTSKEQTLMAHTSGVVRAPTRMLHSFPGKRVKTVGFDSSLCYCAVMAGLIRGVTVCQAPCSLLNNGEIRLAPCVPSVLFQPLVKWQAIFWTFKCGST